MLRRSSHSSCETVWRSSHGALPHCSSCQVTQTGRNRRRGKGGREKGKGRRKGEGTEGERRDGRREERGEGGWEGVQQDTPALLCFIIALNLITQLMSQPASSPGVCRRCAALVVFQPLGLSFCCPSRPAFCPHC